VGLARGGRAPAAQVRHAIARACCSGIGSGEAGRASVEGTGIGVAVDGYGVVEAQAIDSAGDVTAPIGDGGVAMLVFGGAGGPGYEVEFGGGEVAEARRGADNEGVVLEASEGIDGSQGPDDGFVEIALVGADAEDGGGER
jgi:hypothetical protein